MLENEKGDEVARMSTRVTAGVIEACAVNDAHARMHATVNQIVPRVFSFSNLPLSCWKTRRPWEQGALLRDIGKGCAHAASDAFTIYENREELSSFHT